MNRQIQCRFTRAKFVSWNLQFERKKKGWRLGVGGGLEWFDWDAMSDTASCQTIYILSFPRVFWVVVASFPVWRKVVTDRWITCKNHHALHLCIHIRSQPAYRLHRRSYNVRHVFLMDLLHLSKWEVKVFKITLMLSRLFNLQLF